MTAVAGLAWEATWTAMVVHPEAVWLRAECERLRRELARLVFEHDQLRCAVVPNLKADFLLKVGRYDYELFCTQVEVKRLQRTIALLQAAANRGETIAAGQVEAQLKIEYAAWETQMKEMAANLHAAGEHNASLMSDDESAELHRLYRQLARRLHPDVNPGSGSQEQRLWQWAKDAYAQGNLHDLRVLAALVGPAKAMVLPPVDGVSVLEQWRQLVYELQTHVLEQRQRIEAIEREFPCNLRERLEDAQWVAEQQAVRLVALQAAQAQLEQYQKIVADLWTSVIHD